jgi:hypothetical protein
MSLAVLARKTKTKMRSKSQSCGGLTNGSRTKGFILNMTNRGGGIGMSGMSYMYRGSGCGSGTCVTCCVANKTVSKTCREGCSCRFGGLSQPAPQQSYRIYLNRKSNAAYRPGGKSCCNKITGSNKIKNKVIWKQHPDIASSELTEHKKQATLRCARGLEVREPKYIGNKLLSNNLYAKPVCSWKNPVTGEYETVKKCNPYNSNGPCVANRQRGCGITVKPRLSYTRINKNWCNTTKSVQHGNSASDQIGKIKERAFLCNCTGNCQNGKKNTNPQCFRYCFPKPMATAHCSSSMTESQKARVECLRKANSTC